MNEKYNLKIIDKQDISEAVSIVRSSFNPKYLYASIYRGHGIVSHIQNELENSFSPYYYMGLYENNILVGFVEYKLFKEDNLSFLNMIAIRNDYKSLGIGTILFEKTRKFFADKGFGFIGLDVFASNTTALNWYSKLGFKIENTTPFSKVTIKESNNSIDFEILNYPQFKVVNKFYGFYFIELQYGNHKESVRYIDSDLIIRGSKNKELETIIIHLKKIVPIKNVYFIGDNCPFSNSELKDKILRMKLKL